MTEKQQKIQLNLVGEGEIKAAIEGLMEFDLDNSQKQTLTGIASQYQEFQNKKRKGILSFQQETLLFNQITTRLVDFISESGSKASTQEATPREAESTFWQKKGILWLALLGSLASIIALWAIFFPYTPHEATKTVTVLVHGKGGKDRLLLPNRGIVYLIYGDAKIPEQINNEGEATFKQIPSNFFLADAKVEILFEDPKGEPYRAVVPDSLYGLEQDAHIALAVVLEGMEQITGIVKDFETGSPITSVAVRVFGKETHSNKYGEFTLDLPENQQRKFITLRAFKEGYLPWQKKDLPTTTNKEIIIALKK